MIPNLREIERAIHATTASTYQIGCWSCKQPLWEVSNIKRYGTRISADKKAFPGVPEYNDIWSKDGKDCYDINCKLCGEPWLRAIQAGDHVFAKPYIIGIDSPF